MLYGKFYIAGHIANKLYGYEHDEKDKHGMARQGFIKPFLFTSPMHPEFIDFLSQCPRPVYAIHGNMFMIQRSQMRSITYKLVNEFKDHIGGGLIAIPLMLDRYDVPVVSEGFTESMKSVSSFIKAESAMLYDTAYPEGYVDPTLVDDPLMYMKTGFFRSSGQHLASGKDISYSLWKNRNTIRILSLQKYLKQDDTAAMYNENVIMKGA